MFNHRTLKSFIILAETLHFGKTSEQCHMTPSALTRTIQRIEEELGTVLLERNNRTVMLTDAGRAFYNYAKQMEQQWENLQGVLHPDKNHIEGDIRLHCTVTAAYNILPNMLMKLREDYPHIRLQLETGPTTYGLEKLEKDRVDAAISIITDTVPSLLRVKEILASPLCYIGTKHHEALTAPFIMPASGPLKQMIERYFNACHIVPNIHSYVEGHEAILSLVACGIGTSILPEVVLKNSHLREQVSVIPTDMPLPSLKIGLFMRKSTRSSVVKQAFWEIL